MLEISNTNSNTCAPIANLDIILENKKGQFIFKRVFDLIASFIGLITLSPFLLIIAAAIQLDSKGPIFFKQTRVGKDEKQFKIYKFRTMIINAEKKGMQITVGKDSRITKIGCFLRKYKLDELPQLINVLVGEMSFVGPRPEVPRYVAFYNDYQRQILRIKPGITDLASIKYRNESEILSNANDPETMYIHNVMQDKLKLNMQYLAEWSFVKDFWIIIQTILKIIER